MRFRTRAVIGGLLLTSVASSTPAIELRPLADVINQEDSDHIHFYVLERCSAAFDAADVVLERAGQSQMAGAFFSWGVRFDTTALELSNQKGLGATVESIASDEKDIAALYLAAMKENYNATGNDLEGFVKDDVTICSEMAKGAGWN